MIRYGIVGFGLHAVKRLMPGFEKASKSKVVALSRRNQEAARQDAERFSIPHVFSTTEELCQCADVDAVLVTTPNSAHYADVLTCARYGKPVLCEKPMAMNAREAEEMLRAAKEAGVPLGIAQCFRFEDSVRRMRELVQDVELGEIKSMRLDFTFAGLNSPRKWLYDAATAGGGPIADVGVHTLDAMRFVLGDEPVSTSATATTDEHSGGVEASATFELRFERGALGTSFVSFRKEYSTPVEIVGARGALRAKDVLNVDYGITMDITRDGKSRSETFLNDTTYARQVDAFSATVEGGAQFPVPGEEGVRNQKVLDAIYNSIRTGQEQRIA